MARLLLRLAWLYGALILGLQGFAFRGFFDHNQCANPAQIITASQALGCRCTVDRQCSARHSFCASTVRGMLGVCACRAPSHQVGGMCDVPCSIAIDSPDYLYQYFCQKDGTELCEPKIIVIGCQAPYTVRLNLIYSDEGLNVKDRNDPGQLATFLSIQPVRLGTPTGNVYPLVVQNQQALIDILGKVLGPDEERVYTATVTDATGKTAETHPIYLNFALFYGNFPTDGGNQQDDASRTCRDRETSVEALVNCLRSLKPPRTAATFTNQDVRDTCHGAYYH